MTLDPGWCLVLGASSGFGAAASVAFARAGLDVVGVHLDRRASLPNAEAVVKAVEACGRRARFFNANAANPEKRTEIVEELQGRMSEGPRLRVLLHSLAFGTLKPLVARETADVMATSLVDWTEALVAADLLERGGRVFAMTSEGGRRVIPSYGPVAVAKAALEAVIRQLALELVPFEITANAICGGVTETPASAKIPGFEQMLEISRRRNPRGRLTMPEDVAGVLVALSGPECGWLTGNVIQVDGGEGIVA